MLDLQHMTTLLLDRFHTYASSLGRSRTPVRDEVFLTLSRLGRCRPADIRSAMAGKQFNRITVYRTIRFLLEIDAAHELPNGMLELTDRFNQHHHHFSCSQCGRELAFNDERLEQVLAATAHDQGWQLDSHQVELSGRCHRCLLPPAA
jgi:Fe2+ or Zn2+ uptake regulation protein